MRSEGISLNFLDRANVCQQMRVKAIWRQSSGQSMDLYQQWQWDDLASLADSPICCCCSKMTRPVRGRYSPLTDMESVLRLFCNVSDTNTLIPSKGYHVPRIKQRLPPCMEMMRETRMRTALRAAEGQNQWLGVEMMTRPAPPAILTAGPSGWVGLWVGGWVREGGRWNILSSVLTRDTRRSRSSDHQSRECHRFNLSLLLLLASLPDDPPTCSLKFEILWKVP